MDTARTTEIAREILELDPELRKHEAELHAFVRRMEASNPHAEIDARFAAALRREVLGTKRALPSPYMNVGWWFVRLAPIGAVALLLLMLNPYPSSQPLPLDEALRSSDPRILDVQLGGSQPPEASSMGGLGGGGSAADSAVQTESMMSAKSAVSPSQPQSPFRITPQQPGRKVVVESITLTYPSFVVITEHAAGQNVIIGISPLLNAGTTDNVPVFLRVPTAVSGSYSATLYRDNGNRVFSYEKDTLVTDSYGNPLETFITILSE